MPAKKLSDRDGEALNEPRGGIPAGVPAVSVRQEGDAVVLEPAKPKFWPEGFFDSVYVTDPAFERPEQGQLPPVKNL